MKARTIVAASVIAVLALLLSGPATASVGATLAVAPQAARPDTLDMPEVSPPKGSPFGELSFASRSSPLARGVGEGPGVRAAQQS